MDTAINLPKIVWLNSIVSSLYKNNNDTNIIGNIPAIILFILYIFNIFFA